MFELLQDHTFRTVLMGTGMIGAVSGALGCFAYLRRESLIGDVVSHSSLAGLIALKSLKDFSNGALAASRLVSSR